MDRYDFVSKLRELDKEMKENEEAFLKFSKAREEWSVLFCQYSNRNGFHAAQEAQKEAQGEESK